MGAGAWGVIGQGAGCGAGCPRARPFPRHVPRGRGAIVPEGAIPTALRLGGARPALPEQFAPLAGLTRTPPPLAPAPLAAPLPVPRPVAGLPPVPVPTGGMPLLLSLGLHLAPLGLLLGIVSGVVSDGGAGGGGGFVAAQRAEPLMVELVADWTKPAPPPVAFSAAPALPAPQA
ncbi:MAG: hypothetical protein RIR62_1996, partial [Pseudomonadota bacterium]